MRPELRALTWPDVPGQPLVLVPVGSFEQHGPHLPMDTDTVIAVAVASGAAAELGALVAPPVVYGASGEHQAFPGTISIGTDALRELLVELARSLSTWADRIVFVNGHGGNLTALTGAVTLLVAEGRSVSWAPCAVPDGDAHAGHVETSVLLHLDPARVQRHRAVVGNVDPIAGLLPALRGSGVRSVSESGILGDPTSASADTGAALLAAMVAAVVTRVRG